jgi:hypothetical protein
MAPAVDAFINFQHFRSCNVGEYASVNTNLYIRTEGALSCMLSPASILQGSRSGSSPKLQHDKRCFEAVSLQQDAGGTDCICSAMRHCVAEWGIKNATPHACPEQSLICSDTGALLSRVELTNQTH